MTPRCREAGTLRARETFLRNNDLLQREVFERYKIQVGVTAHAYRESLQSSVVFLTDPDIFIDSRRL